MVLVAPSIAPNTGNIIRLCANTGAHLHLVEPLGFELSDRWLKRGGLDYHDLTSLTVHAGLDQAQEALSGRWLLTSAHGTRRHDEVDYRPDDVLVFGNEQWGLPEGLLSSTPASHRLRIPMRPSNRSLNLANAVAIVVYEAWRQAGFDSDHLVPDDRRDSDP